MSETKKQLGRKSRRLGRENRGKILLTILAEEPLTFKELDDKKIVKSKSTLSNHLKNLLDDGLIEQRIENRKVFYHTSKFLDEETVVAELKTGFFDSLIGILSILFPNAKEGVEAFLKSWARIIVQYKKDEVKYGEEEALKRAQKRFQRVKPQKPLKLEFIKTRKRRKKQ